MHWLRRPTLWIVLFVVVAGYGVMLFRQPGFVGTPAPRGSAVPAPTAAVPPVAVAPSFDVVRVAPSGSAVLAGRAAPGTEVTVRDGSSVLGHSTADNRGEWVLVPDAAFAPGARALSLDAQDATGTRIPGAEALVVIVPPRATPAVAEPAPVMAVVVPEHGPARIMQAPTAALALQTIDYDERGDIRFAGSAPPGATLQVYIDNVLAGIVTAGPSGRWSMQPAGAVPGGIHMLRVDVLAGRVVQSRVETRFQRDVVGLPALDAVAGPAPVVAPVVAQVVVQMVVQPGQNLWRIARTAYGEGTRYTLIYTANQGFIRDPNLIYPGQAITVPKP